MVRLRKKSIQRRSIRRTNGSHSRPMKTGITPAYTPSSAKVPRYRASTGGESVATATSVEKVRPVLVTIVTVCGSPSTQG